MGAVFPAVASRTLSAPGPLLARTLRTPPAAPGLGAPGSSLLGVSSFSVPYPARKWDSNNRGGHLQSPTLPSSLPTRGEGMHQPGFTHFSFRCLGSEGTIRPRDWLPAGLLPVTFTSLRVGGGEFPGRERGWAAPGSSLEGWGMRYM